jgi:hypothetical protein
MSTAYSEFIDFIIAGHSPASILAFQPSDQAKEKVSELIRKQKAASLSDDEAEELSHFLEIEHIMRLAKAKAQQQLTQS